MQHVNMSGEFVETYALFGILEPVSYVDNDNYYGPSGGLESDVGGVGVDGRRGEVW